ncbi:MAG: metal-dependent hydrolase [Myxococcales bacterium 68-20]|nr:M48 family metallopeptidase [Myxococcales bacterium]OJY16756.1 MAG: metal-dependent hydrolase [Myxococcales bacterium 68-20]
MNTLTVDDLRFEIRRSPRRRSVQITVDRGGELLLSAPDFCSTRVMEQFVREKRFWIYTKLAEKEARATSPTTKHYMNGEGFPYLGRRYRLLLVPDQDAAVKLEHGRFKMRGAAAGAGRAHMVQWYTERARAWLTTRVERFRARIGVEPAGVSVQDLGYRWGSCGKGAKVYFHWRTILLPPRVVEYLVVHELVHLIEPHHTPAFWTRVERVMPDYASRKQWLAESGGQEWL